jgi:membrane protein DedA with SNARE-associated domain
MTEVCLLWRIGAFDLAWWSHVPEWLIDLFGRYGYLVVFFGVLLENAGIPVPGETALLAGAALSNFGHLSLLWVIAIAVAGATAGDNLGFFVGRRGGRAFAERHGTKVGLTDDRLRQFDRFFERYGGRTVFIARFVTGLRVFGAVLAGGSGLRWRSFLIYNAAGAIVWSLAVGGAGYLLAHSWDTLERWVGGSGLIALGIVLLVATIAVIRSRRESHT